tara:strand:+ start:494 stop:931 length:438 start_codon:yes stop_codon:yes gene_type:complete
MNLSKPQNYKKKLHLLKFRWKRATKNYISEYPRYKMGFDPQRFRAGPLATITQTAGDIALYKAQLTGTIHKLNIDLTKIDNEINKLKKQYKNENVKLTTQLGANNASDPFKADKYNENSKSYIFASYYTISLLTLTFFIYKQIKQ